MGSFVSMYVSASNTKRQAEKDGPYLIFRINEERYNILQKEIYNASNNGAIIKEAILDRDLYLVFGDKTLSERLKDTVIPAKRKVMYPYDVDKDWKKSDREKPYVDVKGTLKYDDFSGSRFENDAVLNLSSLSGQLIHKKESIKRDRELIKAIVGIRKIRKYTKDITLNFRDYMKHLLVK